MLPLETVGVRDDFYDYGSFTNERIESIFKGWDGLGGYHGLLIKLCAKLQQGSTALDIGSGLCHLYEALKANTNLVAQFKEYVGVESHPLILKMARERYPELILFQGDVYDLSSLSLDVFDTTYAIGLYRSEPRLDRGILEMLRHTKNCLILTYFADKKGRVPEVLKIQNTEHEFIEHDIDSKLEIMRVWKV